MSRDIYCVWARKEFPDGRVAEVVPLTYGRARLIVMRGRYSLLDGW
jgi:hypothetical protein